MRELAIHTAIAQLEVDRAAQVARITAAMSPAVETARSSGDVDRVASEILRLKQGIEHVSAPMNRELVQLYGSLLVPFTLGEQ